MRTIARLQEEGKLDIKVTSRFPLEKARCVARHHMKPRGQLELRVQTDRRDVANKAILDEKYSCSWVFSWAAHN